MTWIDEFRPGNKTIYVVFDKESEFSGPRTSKLRPDQVFLGKTYPRKKSRKLINFPINSFLRALFLGTPRADGPMDHRPYFLWGTCRIAIWQPGGDLTLKHLRHRGIPRGGPRGGPSGPSPRGGPPKKGLIRLIRIFSRIFL